MIENYSYQIFKWQERTYIQEFQNGEKVRSACTLSSILTYKPYFKSHLHSRVRKWLLENYPEFFL